MKNFILLSLISFLLISSCTKEEPLEPQPEFAFAEIGEVDLDLINNSQSYKDFNVLIFQKNLADGKSGTAVAWKVVKTLGFQDHHPFHFADWLEADVNDDIGNYTAKIEVEHGRMYEAIDDLTGLIFHYHGESQCFNILSIVNHYIGVVDGNIYRDGKLLGTKEIPVGAYGRFEYEHSLYFVADESQTIQEGDEFQLDQFLENATKFDLTGIKSAKIVVTGGPPVVKFTMENIKYIPDE